MKYWIIENEIDGEKCYFGNTRYLNQWVSDVADALFSNTKEDAEWFVQHIIKELLERDGYSIDKVVVKEVEITIL